MSKLYHHKLKFLGVMAFLLVSGTLPVATSAATTKSSLPMISQSPEQTQKKVSDIQTAIRIKGAAWTARETALSRLSFSAKRKLAGVLAAEEQLPPYKNHKFFTLIPNSRPLPSQFDWKNHNGHNYVSPIKDQGACGSCWAFSVTSALESKAMITLNAPGTNTDLAEQIILSCGQAGTCDGGWPDQAANFLTTSGTAAETYYPYAASNGTCSSAMTGWQNNSYKITDWQYVVRNAAPTVEAIKNALYNSGPLVATMMVYDDFYSYASGVYSYTTGGYIGAHAIVIVGWDDSAQAFIVKNSWGSTWGEAGYVKVAYSELSSVTQLGRQMVLAYGNAIPPNFHCYYSLSKTMDTSTASGLTGSVNVTGSDCGWTALSSADWLTITSGNSGNGNGTVFYSVAPNEESTTRTGTLTIANQVFTVTQSGTNSTAPVCTLTAAPENITVGNTSTLTVNCHPAATSYHWTNSGFATTAASGQVSPHTTTVYSVTAGNDAGSSNTASATVTVSNGTPLPPTSLLSPADAITITTPTYRWQAVAGASSYFLYVSTLSSGQAVINTAYSAASLGCGSGTGTCTVTPDTALENGTSYVWFVLAASNTGYSPWGISKHFSVTALSRK